MYSDEIQKIRIQKSDNKCKRIRQEATKREGGRGIRPDRVAGRTARESGRGPGPGAETSGELAGAAAETSGELAGAAAETAEELAGKASMIGTP